MNFFWALFVVVLTDKVISQSTYKAAVVEYAPKVHFESFTHYVLENVKEYINYIAEAAEEAVDIIVFPENGLTGMGINASNLLELSMEVPDPKQQISPCNALHLNYSKALVDLSCSAQTHRIYVVLNVLERRNTTRNITYYNTNIVLNREGVLISRYSKINLFEEAYVMPGNRTVTFKTDFGVTFGILICSDIIFKKPALELLFDPSVTDIIFSTAWFSELPFSVGLAKQHGYAVANGVNLLSAGLNDPENSNSGSSIYLSDGKIADTYVSGAKSSKMLVATIIKVDKRNTEQCRTITDTSAYAAEASTQTHRKLMKLGMLPSISKMKVLQEDMRNYTFRDLNLNKANVTEEICIGKDRQWCCFVNLTVNVTDSLNYTYKLVIFNGGAEVGWDTIGVRTCGVVACLNTSNTSCGLRHSTPPQSGVFKTMFLKASFPNIAFRYDEPATVNYDLKPLNNYTFCKQTVNNKVELTLTTVNQSSFLTFGIFGRVYNNDHKGTGSFNSAVIYVTSPYVVFIVSILIFLLQE